MKQHFTVSASRELREFVPLERYFLPGDTQKNWVRKKRRTLGRLFGPQRTEPQSRVRAENELRALPGLRPEHWVPPIAWAPAAHALDQAIRHFDTGHRGLPAVCFLIGQPYCGHTEIVERWAAGRNAVVIPAPPHDIILARDDRWFEKHRLDREPWAVPALERWFSRHADDLAVVRRFLDQALSGAWGEGMIGCDSWAWTYGPRH